jgi:hypothetical protein
MQRGIFDMVVGSLHGSPLYLLGDKGYPLLFWLMTLHNQNEKHHLVLELLYYCKHEWGRSIVGNGFGIMKQMFEELLRKIGLHITIVLHVFNACSLFHNLILGRKKVGVEEFMQVIQIETIWEDAFVCEPIFYGYFLVILIMTNNGHVINYLLVVSL